MDPPLCPTCRAPSWGRYLCRPCALALAGQNVRLAYYCADRVWKKASSYKLWQTREDLGQQCCLWLIGAARSYDPSRSARFSTYACQSLIFNAYHNAHRYGGLVHVPASAWLSRAGPESVRARERAATAEYLTEKGARSIPDRPHAPGLEPDERDRLRQAVRALPQREGYVLTRRFALDDDPAWTLDQVGRELGVTRSRVQQLERRALKRLRRYYGVKV